MKLHELPSEFRDLISIVAENKHLSVSAIERDYYIVMLPKNLFAEINIILKSIDVFWICRRLRNTRTMWCWTAARV